MIARLALFASAFLVGCASNPALSDTEFLSRCWNAVPVGGGEYQLSFEAIDFAGITEGGVFVRSTSCPDARLRFSIMPPRVNERFRREENETSMRRLLGVGLRGQARIVPVERRNAFYMRVRVTRILNLERMSDADTQDFIERHHIG